MKQIFTMCVIGAALALTPNARGQSIGPSTINSAGGSATIGANTFEWSVGEMVMVATFSSPTIVVTQGTLQPKQGTSGIVDNALASQLEVFPNPSSSLVNVRFTAPKEGALTYRLIDVTGKILIENKDDVKAGLTTKQMDIASLACATYMLQVSFAAAGDQGSSSSTYKIQKLQ